MVDFWGKLDLSADSDERTIKAAYAKKLKLIDVANDPSEFQLLRDAYKLALSYVSNKRSPAVCPDYFPGFGAQQVEQPEGIKTEIIESTDSYSLVLDGLKNIAFSERFDFLHWLESYKSFDSLDARVDLSARLMHEFATSEYDWPFWLMHNVSHALNWHDVRSYGFRNTIFSQFYQVFENANYVQNVRPNITRFFKHAWKSRIEATEALLDFIANVEPTYHSSLSYDAYQAACAASSAWPALLTAKDVFGWNNLDYATNQVLELSLREARFREKMDAITGDENMAPSDAQENAIWRLRKPYDYLDGYHPIDPIAHVLNQADAYGINKSEAFNPDQLSFYSDYLSGKTGNKSKLEIFLGNIFKAVFPIIIIFALMWLLFS